MTDERKQFYVYILASRPNGALYIGVTSDLPGRIWQHKAKVVSGHSARYDIDKLVHFETYEDAETAIRREKAMKKWNRSWKVQLVEKNNPSWCDLYETLLHWPSRSPLARGRRNKISSSFPRKRESGAVESHSRR